MRRSRAAAASCTCRVKGHHVSCHTAWNMFHPCCCRTAPVFMIRWRPRLVLLPLSFFFGCRGEETLQLLLGSSLTRSLSLSLLASYVVSPIAGSPLPPSHERVLVPQRCPLMFLHCRAPPRASTCPSAPRWTCCSTPLPLPSVSSAIIHAGPPLLPMPSWGSASMTHPSQRPAGDGFPTTLYPPRCPWLRAITASSAAELAHLSIDLHRPSRPA